MINETLVFLNQDLNLVKYSIAFDNDDDDIGYFLYKNSCCGIFAIQIYIKMSKNESENLSISVNIGHDISFFVSDICDSPFNGALLDGDCFKQLLNKAELEATQHLIEIRDIFKKEFGL